MAFCSGDSFTIPLVLLRLVVLLLLVVPGLVLPDCVSTCKDLPVRDRSKQYKRNVKKIDVKRAKHCISNRN